MGIEEAVEGCHHLTGDLVQTGGTDAEIILRTGHLEIVEQRGFEGGVILTTGIDEQTTGFGILRDGTHQRRHFDEIGTGSG